MSAETKTAIERASSALSSHPLFGCGCCTHPEEYEEEHPDGCPVVDGYYTDHNYGDACWKNQGYTPILAAAVLDAAVNVEEMARVLTAHIRKRGDRGWPVRCVCGEEWSPLHQATALRSALLGATS